MADQTIYLVRHGETEWNRAGRVQGHLDSPLTSLGRDQARRAGLTLAALLEGEPPFRLLASPLGRAEASAALILEALGPMVVERRTDDLLKEVSWGRWEGLTRAEIEAREPDLWRWREADPWHRPPPGGESHAMLAERARSWLESVADRPRLIVVGHGAWGRALRGVYQRLPPTTAMALDEPQDALFRLAAGTVARIPIEEPTPGSR
jgi:broad specificity phosphatase PhoE